MAMERVTVEQNGEVFELEVPEGTTDDQIRSFLTQQSGGAAPTLPAQQPGMLEQAGLSPAAAQGVETYATQAAARPAIATQVVQSPGLAAAQRELFGPEAPKPMFKPGPALAPVDFAAREVRDFGRAAGRVTPNIVSEVLQSPLESTRNLVQAVTERYAGQNLNKSIGQGLSAAKGALTNPQTYANVAKGLGRAAITGATAPENLFTLPYQMAAYEQAKIRANPNAPGLEFNPYAQTVRGQAATQSRAGEANRMRTVANMPYGNVTPEERAMLEEDARIRSAVRKKALEKVMGPVAPGSM